MRVRFDKRIVLAVATAAFGCLPAGAWAAARTVGPAARVQARVATGPGVSGGPKVLPVRVRNPGAYARAKRTASGRAGGAAPRPRATAPRSGPRTAVPGALNTAGLSAAQQIAAFGEGNDVTPPDTTGAIGPSDYVEMVNSEIAVYDRASLTPVGPPVDLATFTHGVAPCDVQVKYDPQSGRWFYLALRCDLTTTSNELYVGWSKTSDPTDLSDNGWCKFTVPSSPDTTLDDYPKLGLDGSHIVIGTNDYDATTQDFLTAHVLVGPKPASGPITDCGPTPAFTVFGSQATPLRTSAGNVAFTPEPATSADAGAATGYIVSADFDDATGDASGSNIMVWHVGGTLTSPTLVADGDVAVTSFAVPPNVPQPGSTDQIDTMDGRLTQAVEAVDPTITGSPEAIWTQHTVEDVGGGSKVAWYEIAPTATTELNQSGAITAPAGFAFNGAIAPTQNGGAAIDYNTGGSAQLVDVEAQARNPGDPAGAMTPLGSPLATSSGIDRDNSCPSQGSGGPSCRWGDYAGISVDPSDPNVVWGSNQVNGPASTGRLGPQAQWSTQNFALTPTGATGPTASFTVTPPVVTPGSPVGFDASGSSGVVTGYSWNFGDGSAPASGVTTSHAYSTPGVYTVTLTVSDGTHIATTTHTVTVDIPPVAAFTAVPSATAANALVGFNASGSTDPDGTVAGYSWSFGDGTAAATGPAPTHAYAAPGTYNVTLTVTDNDGLTGTVTHAVTVVPAPTASFTAAPNPALPRSPVAFDGSASAARGGVITAYTWSFGDGAVTSGGPTISHSYGRAGTYTVSLTIADNHGQFATYAHAITIRLPVLRGGLAIPKNQKLRTVLRKGLRVTLSPSERLTATFLITTKVRDPRGRPTTLTLLRTHPRGYAPGKRQVTLRLNAKPAKRIARSKTVFLTLKLTLTDQFGQRRTTSVRVKVRR